MASRDVVGEVALDFLKAVAEAARSQLGGSPERVQRSTWMVRTGPDTMSSNEFVRKVFDRAAVSMAYQKTQMHSDFPEQRRLEEMLVGVGIPRQQTLYGFLLPLVHNWLELPDPFGFEEKCICQVLDEFAEAIIEGRVLSKSVDAIESLDLVSGPVLLEKGVSIRPVTEDELWGFGDLDSRWAVFLFPHPLGGIPSEDWKILHIEVRHMREDAHPSKIIETLRRCALTALRLASLGQLQVIDIGREVNYGMGAVGRVSGVPTGRDFGRWGGRYVLDAQLARRLKDSWPRLRQIMESERHYLRLPAHRLLDGGGRHREDDAIVDYAIGLEALLTEGVKEELRYRFALRGATILGWNGGDKAEFFKELRDFYDVRSDIVHGRRIDPVKVRDARSHGEKALRDIWWWYFQKGASLSKATSEVDGRMLG